MAARRCPKCEVNWASDWPGLQHCPVCDAETSYRGNLEPDGIDPQHLIALRRAGYLVKNEEALYEIVEVRANGIATMNVANGYGCHFDNADLKDARPCLPAPETDMASFEEVAQTVASPPDPVPELAPDDHSPDPHEYDGA